MHTGVRSDERIVDWKSQFPQLGSRLQHREANGTLTVPHTGIYLVRRPYTTHIMSCHIYGKIKNVFFFFMIVYAADTRTVVFLRFWTFCDTISDARHRVLP